LFICSVTQDSVKKNFGGLQIEHYYIHPNTVHVFAKFMHRSFTTHHALCTCLQKMHEAFKRGFGEGQKGFLGENARRTKQCLDYSWRKTDFDRNDNEKKEELD